ncbi:alpha/beta hydrolase [Streptosporangium sp. NPDC006930]|uniref:alpha/beta hydrolase n=1 Tax=unclassified Streptosporangium TaxID=2632669 RepID=UPI0034496411
MLPPNPHVIVLIGPGVVADLRLLTEVADREFAALGVAGTVSATPDVPGFRAVLESSDVLVVLPGPDPEARRLASERPDAVWLDLTMTPHPAKADAPLPTAEAGTGTADGAASTGGTGAAGGVGATGATRAAGTVSGTHMHGRGIWGLTWAIRHAVHRLRRPARRIAYGDHPDQWAEVRSPYGDDPARGQALATTSPPGSAGQASAVPPGEAEGQAPVAAAPDEMPDGIDGRALAAPGESGEQVPTAVLLHGGFWRSIWGADLMDALAVDLAERGFVAWNLEYRRPDLHGWDATTEDVARGVALAAESANGPLVVIGHSAGGQLALRAAADDHRITLAVSLAGVLDLAEGDRRHTGTGAVAAALGGSLAEVPDVYRSSGPLERLPVGVPQLIVQGGGDDLDLVDFSRRYARAAQAAGDQVTYLEMSGDHFDVIDPASPIWRATAGAVAEHRTPS